MPNYAIHDGATVLNVIVADSLETAEQTTGLSALATDGTPWIGWTMEVEGWRPPTPFPSWVWNNTAWEAPIPYPTDGGEYLWDEEQGDWAEVVEPEPEA